MQDQVARGSSRLLPLLIASVALKQCKGDLSKNLPNEILIKVLSAFFTFLNQLREISALAVLHHNVKSSVGLVD